MQFPDVVELNLERKMRNRYKTEQWHTENGIETFPQPCICYERYTNTLIVFCKFFLALITPSYCMTYNI